MEEEVVWPLQCDSHFLATCGTGTSKCDEEVSQLGDLLCGQSGDSNTHPGGPHRATERSI